MNSFFQTPAADGFFLPAEREPHERSWMHWPVRVHSWGEYMPQVHAAYAAIARAVAEFEPVTVIVRPEEEAEARFACGHSSAIEILAMPHDGGRARDTGPMFVIDGMGKVAGVDWAYDGLDGHFRQISSDREIAGTMLRQAGLTRYPGPLVLEGGAVAADGSGTVITTEEVLLHSGRNREHTQQQVEEALALFCGARRIIWLGGGLRGDEGGGHADQIAAFTGPGRLAVAAMPRDSMPYDGDPFLAETLQDMRAELSVAKDARNRSFELVDLPLPRVPVTGFSGRAFYPSYVGFYPVNGGVLVPEYGVDGDAYARGVVADLFPDRKVVGVPADILALAGRSLHSVLCAQPAALPAG